MSTRLLVLVGVVAALTWAAPAVAAPGGSVTATGTKLVKVRPTDRKSNSSIQSAVAAAEKAGVNGALASAHNNAIRYAKAVGLTLGTIISVSDVQNNNGVASTVHMGVAGSTAVRSQPILRHRTPTRLQIVNHKHKLVRFKKVHTCIVPPYQATTLTVTYNAQ